MFKKIKKSYIKEFKLGIPIDRNKISINMWKKNSMLTN